MLEPLALSGHGVLPRLGLTRRLVGQAASAAVV
jgi:hypothetical protein